MCPSQCLHADIFERFAALEKSGARAEDTAGSERRAGGTQPNTEGQRGQDNEDGEVSACAFGHKQLRLATGCRS